MQWDAVLVGSIFSKNLHKRHTIANPLKWDMRCLLWVQTLMYISPQSMQRCIWCHVILDCVITALQCTVTSVGIHNMQLKCVDGARDIIDSVLAYLQEECTARCPNVMRSRNSGNYEYFSLFHIKFCYPEREDCYDMPNEHEEERW